MNLMRPRYQSFEADNDDFTLTLYNLNYGHDYVINVNDTQCDTRNGTQGGAQDKIAENKSLI